MLKIKLDLFFFQITQRDCVSNFRMKSEVMRNALMPNSDDRWVRQKDDDGNFIIPYVITGTYGLALL